MWDDTHLTYIHTYIKALLKWRHNASNSQWRNVNMKSNNNNNKSWLTIVNKTGANTVPCCGEILHQISNFLTWMIYKQYRRTVKLPHKMPIIISNELGYQWNIINAGCCPTNSECHSTERLYILQNKLIEWSDWLSSSSSLFGMHHVSA